ncbi:MAG: sigma-70 family RNA polymerase sigma factor [Proteobacteria bacterium]|nr:sigma-70 family RNA polymerase sigma factor [Pseudomonadota bacterium]
MSKPEDWSAELARVARSGDRDSFLRIYDHFMPRVGRYLKGLGSPGAIAEELAQESLLRLWQHAASYDQAHGAVSTWLFRIARNLHIDRLRRDANRANALVDSEEQWADPAANETETFVECAQLRQRIDALAPVQARLIRMSYFEAKSHQEIASELNMPLGTVKSHLRRAFQRLQGDLGGKS